MKSPHTTVSLSNTPTSSAYQPPFFELGANVADLGLLWDDLDKWLEALECLFVSPSPRQAEALQQLARNFRADAIGLYISPRPGQLLELVAEHGFPPGTPRFMGTTVPGAGPGRLEPRVRSHRPSMQSGRWAQAAQDGDWKEVVIYPVPRCQAALALAYRELAPAMEDGVAAVALKTLALAVRQRQALGHIEVLRRRKDELDHLLMAGITYSNDGVILLDSEGKIITCNQLGGQMLGYAVSEIAGLPAEAVLVSHTDTKQLIACILSGVSALEERTLTLYQRSGEPLPVALRVAPVIVPGRSSPYGAVVFFADRRTERMEAVEENLRQQNAQLEHTLSILAHEIRNPLGSIKAGLDYLETELRQHEEVHGDVKIIQNEIRRLDRLLSDALLVTRSTEIQTTPQSITDLLDGLLSGRARPLAERGVIVYKDYQEDLPFTLIDRAQMEQVFDNLIVNAIHAMRAGGHLSVTVGRGSAWADSNGNRPTIEVKIGDSGPGIAPELHERIFDPFFTTKEGGTGLGLAVARRIVKQHNGTIRVESWTGIGTVFTVVLPVEE